MARALRGDEDLAEAVALVHDFGHTPFGHTGEDALNEKMASWGGFDHNAQSLRIVTRLERALCRIRRAEPDLGDAGGPGQAQRAADGRAAGKGLNGPVPQPIRDYSELHDLELDRFAGIEAQCAAIADDIAYNTHDIDDGLRAGLLTLDMLEDRFAAGHDPEGRARALSGARCRAHRPRADAAADHRHGRGRHRLDHRQSGAHQAAKRRRRCGRPARRWSPFRPRWHAAEKELKAFLYKHLYRHPEVMRVRAGAEQIVRDLFDVYFADPRAMPDGWREGLDRADDRIKARTWPISWPA